MASSRSAVEKSGPQHETVLLSFHLTRFFYAGKNFRGPCIPHLCRRLNMSIYIRFIALIWTATR